MKNKKIFFLLGAGMTFSIGLFTAGLFFKSATANAATTIGTNIITDGALTVTGAATLSSTLAVTGAATLSNVSTLQLNNQIKWDTGIAVTGSNYSIGRDADSTNQLHLNVPSGAKFEFSINDSPFLLIGGEGSSYLYNNFTVGTNVGSASTTFNVVQGAGAGSGGLRALVVTGGAHTNMIASVEMPDIEFALNRTVEFAAGALTNQRAFKIAAPTYAFVGTSTITNAATFYIDREPQQGTNATITNAYALWIDAGTARFDGNLVVESTGFLQFKASGAGLTSGADCDNDSERGRFYIDTSANNLYVCNGASRGWDSIALTN